jgi:hypothetical protein
MPKAMTLADESIKIRRTPQNLFVKARILRWAGRGAEASSLLGQAMELGAKQKSPDTLLHFMEGTRQEWRKADAER